MTEIPKYKVLLFVTIVIGVLGLFSYTFPKGGIDVGFTKISFFSSDKLWYKKPVVKKDISQIVASVDTSGVNVDDLPIKYVGAYNEGNATQGSEKSDKKKTEKGASLNAIGGNSRLLGFFNNLEQGAANKRKIRILHFGDSQIEGDRMTGYIRQRLQEKYGGNGPGLIPANNVYPTNSFKQNFSPNFMRYTCFGGSKLANRKYGLMNSAARFTAESLPDTDTTISEGWIEISPSNGAYGRARSYNHVKLFYNSCFEKCDLTVLQNGQVLHEETLIADGKYHVFNLDFPGNPGTLKFVFKSRLSPTIMGFSLEGGAGVQVDNIAMRGSSGTFLGAIDRTLFAQQMSDLSADMIIMQFGGNSMPLLKDKKKVENFAGYIKGQLSTLKKLRPNSAILFIGPSDMSTLIDGEFQTYPMLPYCVEQLKKVTKSLGIDYFDMFQAMGGENSMPSWVEQGLAGKDYIHFSPKGASIASQMVYDALLNQYIEKKGN